MTPHETAPQQPVSATRAPKVLAALCVLLGALSLIATVHFRPSSIAGASSGCAALQAQRNIALQHPADLNHWWALLDLDLEVRLSTLGCEHLLGFEDRGRYLGFLESRYGESGDVWYRTATYSLIVGDRLQALTRFSRALTLGNRGPDQIRFVARIAQSKNELLQIAPREAGPLILFLTTLKRYRPDFSTQALPEIRGLLENAFSGGAFESLEPDLLKRASQLAMFSRADSVRRALDRKTVEIATERGDRALSSLLEIRAERAMRFVPRALVKDDAQPTREMLATWHSPESQRMVRFDQIGTSIGAMFGPSEPVDLVLLTSNRSGTRFARSEIVVYVSDDNFRFEAVVPTNVVYAQRDKKDLLLFHFARPLNARYIKVSYHGTNRRGDFHNYFSDIVQFYGPERDVTGAL